MTQKQIVSRETAALGGLIYYFTNRPCRAGHVVERYVSTGNCVECAQQRASRFRRASGRIAPLVVQHFQRDLGLELVTYWVHPEDRAAMDVMAKGFQDERERQFAASRAPLPPPAFANTEEDRAAMMHSQYLNRQEHGMAVREGMLPPSK